MKHLSHLYAITFIPLVFASLLGCSRRNVPGVNHDSSPPTAVVVDARANEIFLELVAGDTLIEMNNGITVRETNNVTLPSIATVPPDYHALLILNHTEEPVKFDDIGFGIRLFQYDPLAEGNGWEEVKMPYRPEETEKVLPPRLEEFDFQLVNSWELFADDLINVNSKIVRCYVHGVGMYSNKHYGAFIDLRIGE